MRHVRGLLILLPALMGLAIIITAASQLFGT